MELSAPAELFHDDTMPVIMAGINLRKGFVLSLIRLLSQKTGKERR